MKKLFIIIGALFLVLAGCEQDTEFPLILLPTAEPSSKMCNDRGIDHYRQKDYQSVLIDFVQARTADHTAGEIHFNLALTRLKLGEEDKARESFRLAVKHAYGNPQNPAIAALEPVSESQKTIRIPSRCLLPTGWKNNRTIPGVILYPERVEVMKDREPLYG